MNKLQEILCHEFPHIEGLQDTTLGVFSPPAFNNLLLKNRAVSMDFSTQEIISQVSSMVRGRLIKKIVIEKLYCQKQKNSYDCGPMAAVFAYMFCKGTSPNQWLCEAETLRTDIAKVAMGQMDFSEMTIIEKMNIIEPKVIDDRIVYCKCRSNIEEGLKLCFECMESFHVGCELVFDEKCSPCRNKMNPEEYTISDDSSKSSSSEEIDYDNTESKKVEYYTTKYGNHGIYIDGYSYVLKRKNKFSEVYICRASQCKSTVKICEGVVEEEDDFHEHEIDTIYILKREAMNDMKKRCSESLEPIPTIYENCLQELNSKNEQAAAEFQPFE